MIKEKIYRHNLPDDIIEKAIEHDTKVKEQIKENKLNRKTQLQKIECEYFQKPHMVTKCGQTYEVVWSEEDVMDVVIKYYKENEILVRDFMLISLVRTLCLKYVPSYDYSYKKLMLEKLRK